MDKETKVAKRCVLIHALNEYADNWYAFQNELITYETWKQYRDSAIDTLFLNFEL